ncbi:hypothetical protein ACFYSH_22865 [Streptomyces sp. NPDC005791]|uniref:hypothetical protein n=1 Tax=Streptomyces sp. NPDC005791 TaxID=3364732 RepID=UPI00369E5CBB
MLWISPALPGRTHDLTAARTHKIVRICERRGVPSWPTAPAPAPTPGSPPDGNGHRAVNPPTQRTVNRAPAQARVPVELARGVNVTGRPRTLHPTPPRPHYEGWGGRLTDTPAAPRARSILSVTAPGKG